MHVTPSEYSSPHRGRPTQYVEQVIEVYIRTYEKVSQTVCYTDRGAIYYQKQIIFERSDIFIDKAVSSTSQSVATLMAGFDKKTSV